MSERLFSEDEVQKLIRRAAELEAERSVTGKGGGKNGLTIDELKAVASEAGLDPQLIEKAAVEMAVEANYSGDRVKVNREEIVSEIWLDQQPDRETTELLVTELNHIYGTTDELNWWNNLWGTHEGKAKVKRSPNTTEWNYATEGGIYFTRVLLQQRDKRFRIRVSKRQIMGMEWNNSMTHMFLVIPVLVLLGVFGGIGSSQLIGTAWPGIVTGMSLSLFGYPVIRHFMKQSLEKHKSEVLNTARQLSDFVMQSSSQKTSDSKHSGKNSSASEIEIPDEPDSSGSQPGTLRNSLRQ